MNESEFDEGEMQLRDSWKTFEFNPAIASSVKTIVLDQLAIELARRSYHLAKKLAYIPDEWEPYGHSWSDRLIIHCRYVNKCKKEKI